MLQEKRLCSSASSTGYEVKVGVYDLFLLLHLIIPLPSNREHLSRMWDFTQEAAGDLAVLYA
jgi:hypothetical protein